MLNASKSQSKRFGDCPCPCVCHKNKQSSHAASPSEFRDKTLRKTLTDSVIEDFQLYATRRDNVNLISSIDWDQSGDSLLSCCRNSTITVHSLSRDSVRHLYSRKHGAHGGRFLHGGQTHCIVAAKPPPPRKPMTVSSLLSSLSYVPWNISDGPPTPIPYAEPSMLPDSPPHPSDNGTLRYWDLRENRFICTFPLHASVSLQAQLSVSQPPSELICSPCIDGTIRFYDLQREKPVATLQTGRKCHLQAFLDSRGTLAAVQILPFTVQLLDMRKDFNKADYMSIDIDVSVCKDPRISLRNSYITNVQITHTPTPSLFVTLLNNQAQPTILHYDVYTGCLKNYFITPCVSDKMPAVTCWKHDQDDLFSQFLPFQFTPHISPDGGYLACGSGSESMLGIWSTKREGLPLKTIDMGLRIARQVQWNPTQSLLVSACDHLAFWGPPRL